MNIWLCSDLLEAVSVGLVFHCHVTKYHISHRFRQNICFYISVVIRPYIYRVNISPELKSWNITYMDRYMPLVGIYWSIYVILIWFKRSGLILTDICNGLITPDIWKHIWSKYGNIYRSILKVYWPIYVKFQNFDRYMSKIRIWKFSYIDQKMKNSGIYRSK